MKAWDLVPKPTGVGNTTERYNKRRQRRRTQISDAAKDVRLTKAGLCAPASEVPAADEGELDSVDHGDEEGVAAHYGSDSESDKDKQRRIAASIEHQLTHNPQNPTCVKCV